MQKVLKALTVLVITAIVGAIGINQYIIYKVSSGVEEAIISSIRPDFEAKGMVLEYSGIEGRGLANKPTILVRGTKISRKGFTGIMTMNLGDLHADYDSKNPSSIAFRINGPLIIEENGTAKTEVDLSSPLVLEASMEQNNVGTLKGYSLKFPDFMQVGAPNSSQESRYRISYDQNPQFTMSRDGVGGETLYISAGNILISNLATNTVVFRIDSVSNKVEKTFDKNNAAIETIKTESTWDGLAFTAYLEVPILQHLLTRPAKIENINEVVVDITNPSSPTLKSAKIEKFSFSRKGFLFEIVASIARSGNDPLPIGQAQIRMSNPEVITNDLKMTGHVSIEDRKTFETAMFTLASFGYIDEDNNLNFLLTREAGKPLYVGDKKIEEVFAAVGKILEPALKEVPVKEDKKTDEHAQPEIQQKPEQPQNEVSQ